MISKRVFSGQNDSVIECSPNVNLCKLRAHAVLALMDERKPQFLAILGDGNRPLQDQKRLAELGVVSFDDFAT